MKKTVLISFFSDLKGDHYFTVKDIGNVFWHYKKDGRGYSKSKSILETKNKTLISELEFCLVCEKDNDWFNGETEPVNGIFPLKKFNTGKSDEISRKFYSYCKLNRNGQIIGTFPLEILSSINMARTDNKHWFENMRIQCQLFFKVKNEKSLSLDDIFDTQANKTQYNDSKITKNKALLRILGEQKEIFANQCWTDIYKKRKIITKSENEPENKTETIKQQTKIGIEIQNYMALSTEKLVCLCEQNNLSKYGTKLQLANRLILKNIKPVITHFENTEQKQRFGTVYLLRTREFKNKDENVFKIGKTRNEPSKTLGTYGNGCELIFASVVQNEYLDRVEKELILNFKKKFKQRGDIGTEWFEGNFIDMAREIYNFCLETLQKI